MVVISLEYLSHTPRDDKRENHRQGENRCNKIMGKKVTKHSPSRWILYTQFGSFIPSNSTIFAFIDVIYVDNLRADSFRYTSFHCRCLLWPLPQSLSFFPIFPSIVRSFIYPPRTTLSLSLVVSINTGHDGVASKPTLNRIESEILPSAVRLVYNV